MKKLLLATAIAALSVSAANAAPTLYGKAFLAADYVNAEFDGPAGNMYDEDTIEINSHASRIGIKGSEAMTANTDVIYQLEYGTSVDGDTNGFTNRDTYLGVINKQFGEFRVGKNQSTLDRINNVITADSGYWDNLGQNEFEGEAVEALNMADSRRVNSSIIWTAPKYDGLPLEISAMYNSDDQNNNDNSGFGVAAMFDQGTGFTAGVAYDKDTNISGDIIRGTATVDLGKFIAAPVTLGALYQVADYDYDRAEDTKKEKGLIISAAMPLTNFARPASIYAQYNKTDNLNGWNNADSDQIVVGGKYFFKDNMIMHAYAGMNNADNVRSVNIDGDNVTYGPYGDAEVFVVGTGLEYKF
ncbi:porin [Psychrobacter maritimus]|jgi:predicted porin|uniref:porin n=1 Tax=Psychrobacter maritimus TaxID=256325 RepID=UPI00248CBC0A|nr:porin [Psychrobacter sp. WB2]WGV13510.1 porin [Psychrobacter sp. WB2]